MRQQVDIADVETATKIRAKYLRALENEEFGLLPGNTFVKTFLRTYAEYLGLDPQLLLEEYRAGYEPRENDMPQYPAAPPPRRRRMPSRPRGPSGPPGAGTALIVGAGVVLVILLILGLTSGGGNDKSSSKGGGKAAGGQAGARHHRAPRVTKVRLRVAPTTATYLCVDKGQGTPILYQGTTRLPQVFRGKHLRLNAGNSSSRISVNGKRVHVPPGPNAIGWDFRVRHGKVAKKPLPLGRRPCA